MIAAVGLQARGTRDEDLVEVLTFRTTGDSVRIVTLAARMNQLRNGDTIDLRDARLTGGLPPLARYRSVLLRQPGGDLWATNETLEGARSDQDITFLRNGIEDRVEALKAAGDDASQDWAPDGSRLLIYTDRYDNASQGDQAIYDLGTGRIRPLTTGPGRETSGRWSPDGTRIAWISRDQTSEQNSRLCWSTTDGRRQNCFPVADFEPVNVLGWLNESELIITAETQDATQYVIKMDLDRRIGHAVFQGRATSLVGPWVVCQCAPRATGSFDLSIRNVNEPELRFPIRTDNTLGSVLLSLPAHRRRHFVDSLIVTGPAGDSIPVGTPPFRLTAKAIDRAGAQVAFSPAVLLWTSSDSQVVSVDGTGSITAVNPGTATILASAGGWREGRIHVRVTGESRAIERLSEDWDSSWTSRWQPLGVPRPLILFANGRRLFWHRGDSSNASGAHSRQAWSAMHGLALETDVWLDIRAPHWQNLGISFMPISDSSAMSAWDHFSSYWLPSDADEARSCNIGIPGGEGRRFSNQVVLISGGVTRRIPVDSTFRRRRSTVRLQILSDGRCAVAIDGRVAAVSQSRIPLDLPMHAWIVGMSHRTRILVGRVRIWSGVPDDIDWNLAK